MAFPTSSYSPQTASGASAFQGLNSVSFPQANGGIGLTQSGVSPLLDLGQSSNFQQLLNNSAASDAGQTDTSDVANLANASGTGSRRQLAEEFEAVFLNTMLAQMFSGIEAPEPFGGGHAEETYRGLMIEEYSKAITQSGGIGVADAIERQLIALQEGTNSEI